VPFVECFVFYWVNIVVTASLSAPAGLFKDVFRDSRVEICFGYVFSSHGEEKGISWRLEESADAS